MARIAERNGDKEESNIEEGLEYGICGVVIMRPRRVRGGPVTMNALVVEGDGRFEIVGEIFDTGYGNIAFRFLRGWRKRPAYGN